MSESGRVPSCPKCEVLRGDLDVALHALRTIRDEDYRGNRPTSAVVAERVLRMLTAPARVQDDEPCVCGTDFTCMARH